MPQPIQLNRTTSVAAPATALLAGEAAVCIAPGLTRFWLGDGTANRLLLSSNPNDPLGSGIMQGNYLPTSGGTMSGAITLLPPVNAGDATNKNYVDALVASLRTFLGTWQVAANIPNITAGGNASGDFYFAVTANPTVPENAPGSIPGIGGQSIGNGDLIIWNTVSNVWDLIRGGPLTLAEVQALFLALAGGTMTGPLVLAGSPTLPTQAANKAYVDGLMTSYLPLSGGTLTGAITMTGVNAINMGAAYTPTLNTHVATKSYVDSTTVATDGVSILGTGVTGSPLTAGLIDGGTF
jgi:hypothetical protein